MGGDEWWVVLTNTKKCFNNFNSKRPISNSTVPDLLKKNHHVTCESSLDFTELEKMNK
jgi:hypothetical protein